MAMIWNDGRRRKDRGAYRALSVLPDNFCLLGPLAEGKTLKAWEERTAAQMGNDPERR